MPVSVATISPLVVDYVDDTTKGLAGGYLQLTAGISALIYSFVYLSLAEHINLMYICFIAGGVCFLAFLYMMIFVIDVKKINKLRHPSHRLSLNSSTSSISSTGSHKNCCSHFLHALSQIFIQTWNKKILILIYFVAVVSGIMDTGFTMVIPIWISKYLYDGDTTKISY